MKLDMQLGGNDGSCLLKSSLAMCVVYDPGMEINETNTDPTTEEKKCNLNLWSMNQGKSHKSLGFNFQHVLFFQWCLWSTSNFVLIFFNDYLPSTEWLDSCMGGGSAAWLLCTGKFPSPILWIHCLALSLLH